jgi:hypothetical protein
MSDEEELKYLTVLSEFLSDQYARTHDLEIIEVIAAITERSEYLIGRSRGRAA